MHLHSRWCSVSRADSAAQAAQHHAQVLVDDEAPARPDRYPEAHRGAWGPLAQEPEHAVGGEAIDFGPLLAQPPEQRGRQQSVLVAVDEAMLKARLAQRPLVVRIHAA